MAWLSLEPFCRWLAGTPVSQTIQTIEWIIPALQTVHILAVACVVTSALMIDLRLLGLGRHDQPVAAIARRFLPFIWWPLPVLAATGALLIAAEPARSLRNPVFLLKMELLVLAAGITLLCQIPLRRNAAFWDLSAGRRRLGRLIALASLPAWIGVVFAGRWIAYIQGV
ncbi:MAG: hypothetical protein JSR67_09040 [Proteobacteria bacterium]|nr:hypothetical protein [Pseudomonadota bacterium]